MTLFQRYVQAVKDTKVWSNKQKPWVLAWAIAEQGENRFAINGMGELARYADNYHSLHVRREMTPIYPCVYHLKNTTEVDNNYIDFNGPGEELEGLWRFIHRSKYGDVDAHMGSFEELLRFICPTFCPTPGYVEKVLSFIPEAEAELRKIGWKPEEETVPQPTMGFNVRNGLLYVGDDPVPFFETPNYWKWRTNKPKSIVIHYTASEGLSGIINWFQNKTSQVSAHLLISKTGTVVQFVPFHKPAWHSGRDDYNYNSIGIELEGFGCSRVKLGSNVVFNIWKGVKLVPTSECLYAPHGLEPFKWRWWPAFTQAQYDALDSIIPVLRGMYGDLKLIGHDALGVHKLDPGPNFDWRKIGL
jgi:N-acetylmuramoyl-L-alanine amidase